MNCLYIGVLSIVIFVIIVIIINFNKSNFSNNDDYITVLEKEIETSEQQLKEAKDRLSEAHTASKKSTTIPHKPQSKIKSIFNHKKCQKCMVDFTDLGKGPGLCPSCKSENYDAFCKPIFNEVGSKNNVFKPTNCVSPELSDSKAWWYCKSISGSTNPCTLIMNDKLQDYQASYVEKNCEEGSHYCAFDESDACSGFVCNLGDKTRDIPFEKSTNNICSCEPVPDEKLPPGIGREIRIGTKSRSPNVYYPTMNNNNVLRNFGYNAVMDYKYTNQMDLNALDEYI